MTFEYSGLGGVLVVGVERDCASEAISDAERFRMGIWFDRMDGPGDGPIVVLVAILVGRRAGIFLRYGEGCVLKIGYARQCV